jgi:hypothetical protein
VCVYVCASAFIHVGRLGSYVKYLRSYLFNHDPSFPCRSLDPDPDDNFPKLQQYAADHHIKLPKIDLTGLNRYACVELVSKLLQADLLFTSVSPHPTHCYCFPCCLFDPGSRPCTVFSDPDPSVMSIIYVPLRNATDPTVNLGDTFATFKLDYTADEVKGAEQVSCLNQ